MKKLISGFLHGVAGAFSGLMPVTRNGKRGPSRKTASSKKHLARSPRGKKSPGRSRRVRAGKSRQGHSRRKLNPVERVTPNSGTVTVTRTVAIYSCPTCGLQGQASLMAEHFIGCPNHQRGAVPPEPTDDKPIEQESGSESGNQDPRESLRNLLQILLPPRAFGRRHQREN